jgi:23S rRNA U2552 (ribose-2'-O)-methylase RlmE/FtsJ
MPASGAVTPACRYVSELPGETFRDLFKAHNGKVSDKWSLYLDVYEEVFACLRDRPVALLEIGVQNGGPLEIWADYFRNAKAIVGVDIDPHCSALSFGDERISVIVGDVTKDETCEEVSSRAASFDIIVDDGSHISSDITAAFFRLLRLLDDDGNADGTRTDDHEK